MWQHSTRLSYNTQTENILLATRKLLQSFPLRQKRSYFYNKYIQMKNYRR